MTDNQVSSGQKVKGSPLRDASTVNLMLRAAHAYRDTELGSPDAPDQQQLDRNTIKLKNSSGSDLLRGSVLAIGDALLTDLDPNYLWYDGDAVADATDAIAIYTTATPDDDISKAKISGPCTALINVTDITHKWADVTAGETVLASGESGRVEILSPLSETGEQECAVNIVSTRSSDIAIERVTVCSQSMSRQLLVTWVDNIASGAGGSAVVSYTDSPIGAVSFTEGWEGVRFDPDDSSPVGDIFGVYETSFSGPLDIRYVGFGCVGGSWQVAFGTNTGIYAWNATVLTSTPYTNSAAPVTWNESYSGFDVDYTVSEVYGVGLSWEKNTAAGWAAANKELPDNYAGIESDTGKYRIGPGNWNDLTEFGGGGDVAAANITDATADGIALITSADANPFTDDDETKLDGIEALADVTDTTNVTAAGALMDSEVTNLPQVKAFDSSDYATAAQGALADSATQPGDLGAVATSNDYDDLSNKPTLGTAAAAATGDFATAAQGSTADSALQPGDVGTAAAQDVGYFATAAQGALADSATQPGDLGTAAAEDVGYFATAAQGTTADSALQDIVDDTTPQLGGDLDAQANSITDLANVTFRTGASGGALRTGTTAADKFILAAYDVDGAAYTTMLQANAGNSPSLLLPVDTLNLADATDTTKIAQFDASGITTATTRTFTLPDESGTIALTGGLTTLPTTKCRDATAGQTVTNATGTKLNLDTTDVDTDSQAVLASNQIEVTADGTYLCIASWGVIDSNLDELFAGIAINGTVVSYALSGTNGGSVGASCATEVLILSEDDAVSIYGFARTDNSSSVVSSTSTIYQPTLQVIRIG